MGVRACVFAVLALTSCIRANLVECVDGRVCPDGTVCDVVHLTCVTPAQTIACDSLADGDRCEAAGLPGVCDANVCVPGCGDGVDDADEECDDGNDRDHDGCTVECRAETPQWTRWTSPWTGRSNAGAAYDDGVGIVVFGGTSNAGVHADHWLIVNADDWQLSSPPGPSSRTGMAFAFDSARNRIVMFGGLDGNSQPLRDTWELSGNTWTHVMTTPSPPAGGNARMVFDSARNRMVLFGGNPNDTWEYRATMGWSKVAGGTSAPPWRVYHTMAYDSVEDVVVVHGGVNDELGVMTDTWEYNGTWTETTAATRPPARVGATMAYSPLRDRTVLFGGVVFPDLVGNDTWEYDGAMWSRSTGGVVTPPGRYFASMTIGPEGEVMLIGGADQDGQPRADVWRYSNSVWVDETPNFVPDPREVSIVYDEARSTVVMYGGSTILARGDAWQFDGERWREGAGTLLTRRDHGLAYDSKRERAVLFGGVDQTSVVVDTTLEWDGTGWGVVSPTTSPSARLRPAIAYDANTGVVVLFGGRNGGTRFDDTWEYDGTTWTQITTSPSPPAGEHMHLAYDPVTLRIVGYAAEDATTWVYENRTWRRFTPEPSPPKRAGGNLVHYAPRGTTMLMNGFASNLVYDETLWELSFDADDQPHWNAIDVAGVKPEPRYAGGAAYMPTIHSMVVFGGTSQAGPRADTWLFTYD